MKLKHIAAAVAMAAASAPSFATLNLPSTGNGEFFAVVLDRVDQVSYLVDLGLSLDPGVPGASQFDANSNFSLALTSANFAAFFAATGTTANDLEFAVMTGDTIGSSASNPRRMFTTVNSAAPALGNGLLVNATNNMVTFANYQTLEATGQTHTSVDNGDGWASAGNNAYFLQHNFDTFNGVTASQGWANTNTVGTAAAMWTFATSSTSGGAATIKTTLPGVWTLDNAAGAYTLNYTVAAAPVPEADGLVLLGAGLAGMGFVGRRRKKA